MGMYGNGHTENRADELKASLGPLDFWANGGKKAIIDDPIKVFFGGLPVQKYVRITRFLPRVVDCLHQQKTSRPVRQNPRNW